MITNLKLMILSIFPIAFTLTILHDVYLIIKYFIHKDRFVRTEGVIKNKIDFVEVGGNSFKDEWVHVFYETDVGTESIRLPFVWAGTKIGQKRELIYNPNDQKEAYFVPGIRTVLELLIKIVIASVFFAIIIFLRGKIR